MNGESSVERASAEWRSFPSAEPSSRRSGTGGTSTAEPRASGLPHSGTSGVWTKATLSRRRTLSESAPRHSVSVAAVIVDSGGRALAVCRRDNRHWEPPGGVLELGETIEDGLCREVAEETGLIVEVDRLTGVYKNMAAGVIALVFRCRAIGGELRTSDETAGFRWMTPTEIRADMAEAYAIRLLDALGDELAVRAHDGVILLPSRLDVAGSTRRLSRDDRRTGPAVAAGG